MSLGAPDAVDADDAVDSGSVGRELLDNNLTKLGTEYFEDFDDAVDSGCVGRELLDNNSTKLGSDDTDCVNCDCDCEAMIFF